MAETLEQKCASAGHPWIEELKLVRGTIPTSDPREFFGDFRQEEDMDDFLAALRDWRGDLRTGATELQAGWVE